MNDGILKNEDLNKLPIPDSIEELSYEALLSDCKNELQNRMPALNMARLPESDPINKVFEVLAYRELLVRQSINEAVKGCYWSLAKGDDSTRLMALISGEDFNALNQEMDKQDTDVISDLSQRQVPSIFSQNHTAGSETAYQYFARQAAEDWLEDVSVQNLSLGVVSITLLPKMWPLREKKLDDGEGRLAILNLQQKDDMTWFKLLKSSFENKMPWDEIIKLRTKNNKDWAKVIDSLNQNKQSWQDFLNKQRDIVQLFFSDDRNQVRPIGHEVKVSLAKIQYYEIHASIGLRNKPGKEQVLNAAIAAVHKYTSDCYRLGVAVRRSALLAAIQQPGMKYIILKFTSNRIEIKDEDKGIDLSLKEAAFCPYIKIAINKAVPDFGVEEKEMSLPEIKSNETHATHELRFKKADKDYLLTHYAIYWGDENRKRLDSQPLATFEAGMKCRDELEGEYLCYSFDSRTKPDEAFYLLVYVANENGENPNASAIRFENPGGE